MKTAAMITVVVLILIILCDPAETVNSSASTVSSIGQQNKNADSSQLRSQKLSSLQARIHIVSQQIATLQAQITAIETAHNTRVKQLQKILASPQSSQKTPTKKGSTPPKHSVGFKQTPMSATLSVNGADITLAPGTLSIKGVQQIVLRATIIHLKSSLLRFNNGNRPLAGSGDVVAGTFAHTPTGIPIPNMFLHGLIVTGSPTVLVP